MSTAKQFGTIGEIWQGPYVSGTAGTQIAIMTLPCPDLYSEITIRQDFSQIPIPAKSRAVIRRFLDYFDLPTDDSRYTWQRKTTLIESIGMASSTADLVATILALGKLHKIKISPNHVQDLLYGIERSDPIFFPSPGVYLSKQQHFVKTWTWKPAFDVAYTILPGKTCTEAGQEHVLLDFYTSRFDHYQESLDLLQNGFAQHSLDFIGHAATASCLIFQEFDCIDFVEEAVHLTQQINALGVFRAHTGNITGFLFRRGDLTNPEVIATLRSLFADHNTSLNTVRAGYGFK